MFIRLLILISLFPFFCFASEKPAFKVMRFDEDWSAYENSYKHIPISEKGFISVGGEWRERYEYYSNFLFGAPLNHGDGYMLNRLMAHADFQFSTKFRFFVQLKSNTVTGRELPPREIDKDELDLHQAFIDWKFDPATLRLGRQELSYGSSRLVSVREGPNVRQSFDAIKMMAQTENWTMEGFASRPVETNPWVFDDSSDPDREFYGFYSTFNKQLDFYWFLLERKEAEYHNAAGTEDRQTIGTRFFSEKGQNLDYDLEAAYQFGNISTQSIKAWTVATNTGYTWHKTKWEPRIGLKANIASGDANSGDKTLGTFNALFPKGAYFNEAAIIGPANIMDLHPSVSVNPHEDLMFSVDWDFLWRQSLEDGLYNLPLNPIILPGDSNSRYIGSQLAFSSEWEISRHFFFLAQYMHFFTGSFLDDVTPGRDIDFYTMWVTYKF